ncbi:type II toxin-antitoxin system ParD family antitoxin [Pedobacter petrophilus]|uniref:Type II toxin-antitoxin system ParD family antitoxin n=1 Tax=Pedobacter petrophilus TaxID=1908241 RepID=A0A7K0G1X3_9SPHI|nr:type II toxin-antitoxin system ParD family antitoxin [Pedobacter petrophilus]MRX77612.1 type II toxin-antitoxin system ParD family antitoxin [Pedobacter petrophilus]
MAKNTSMVLGDHFEHFVDEKISEGRFKNVSEMIRAGLRLLEEEEQRVNLLRAALKAGEEGNLIAHFDPKAHLEKLHQKHLK